MWFIRLFIAVIGFELLYMVFWQETTTFIRHGYSYTLTLGYYPVRFGVLFVGLLVFELILIRLHRDISKEESSRSRKRKNKLSK